MAAKDSKKRENKNDRAPKPGMVRVATASFPKADDPEKARASADLMLRPSSAAGAVAVEYLKPTFGEQDLRALVDSLEAQTAKLKGNDLSDCEAMLFGQAQALQSIFVALARRATKQESLTQWEAYIRVALKAQNQCRMTLETLATVRSPPVVYAKQANIANGPQQVNNGSTTECGPRAGQVEIAPSKLLEHVDGQRLDDRAPAKTGSADTHMATVGTVNGTDLRHR